MKIVSSGRDCRQWRRQHPAAFSLGFIPTMGSLHQGHISLIEQSLEENDSTAVSIYVNRIQFDSPADYDTYPRDLEADLSLCKSLGIDMVFTPPEKDMFPGNFTTYCEVVGLDQHLCGAARPGHFKGVCTVVLKLLNLIQPQRAYFGKKDFQQARIIQQMASDLNLNVSIILGETVREPSGLAMSSRNRRLTKDQRKRAASLYQSLQKARAQWQAGAVQADTLLKTVREGLELKPEDKVDYITLASQKKLEPLTAATKPAVLALAVFFGSVRLIDNILL